MTLSDLSDLTKYSMTRSMARSLCDSWASWIKPVCTVKRWSHLRYGYEYYTSIVRENCSKY